MGSPNCAQRSLYCGFKTFTQVRGQYFHCGALSPPFINHFPECSIKKTSFYICLSVPPLSFHSSAMALSFLDPCLAPSLFPDALHTKLVLQDRNKKLLDSKLGWGNLLLMLHCRDQPGRHKERLSCETIV